MTGTLTRPPAGAGAPLGRRGIRVPVLAGLAILIALPLIWVVAFSSLLGMRTETVRGARVLSVQQVRSAAAVANGTPLIRLDTAKVRRRVESLPDVASARVTVSYPSTVVIAITERIAIGYLPAGEGFVLVDSTGAQYRTVSAEPTTLPRFGLPAGSSARATGQAVATVAAALTRPVLLQLAQITATSPASIRLVLRDGRTVEWGSASRDLDKSRLLTTLLSQHGTSFDISNPDLVVVR